MQIWPHSATLAEDGVTAAAAAPAKPAAAPGAGAAAALNPMGGVGAGEIVLNRAESAALAALETEEDEAVGMKRAADESGLTKDQIEKLKARAKTAIGKGFTLKGLGFTKKPTPAAPDEPGLTRDKAKKEPTAKKATETAVVTRAYGSPLYTCEEVESYGYPTPQSASEPDSGSDAAKETNTMTTLAAMLRRNRMKKR